ncbi:hypothetical protein HDV01_002077 [Terramyces sp. JEL0728]|nr:hypothetical protein HDV01_002077 [Terramyces sp. JEL0728]
MGASESKIAFRKQVFNLSEPDIEQLELFYTLPETTEDIFNLCAHKDIRIAIEKQPHNVTLLIETLIERLEKYIKDPVETKEASNCIRLLTRILPFIFEASNNLENNMFWSVKGDTCLGTKLSVIVSQLLFLRGFTIPSSKQNTPHVQYIIWQKGIGASTAPPAIKEEIVNRIEVMRLLLTLLSRTMYSTAGELANIENLWAREFCIRLERKAALAMLCSFTNTITNYDPIGWATLPYNHASKSYLPGSAKAIKLTTDLLVLVWHYMDTNKKFLAHLCQSPNVLVLLQAIMVESLDARTVPSKLGILRLNCFILHRLSQDRNFGIRLNENCDVSILGQYTKLFPIYSSGCWGDLLYLYIYVLLSTNTTARQTILHLQESYLSSMANVSHLVTKFTSATANKLFNLFQVYSSPRYLLSRERNYTKLFYLLYIIDTILQYQYAGNSQIVYTFVRNREKILSLRDMDFEKSVEQVQKLNAQSSEGNLEISSSTDAIDGESPKSVTTLAAQAKEKGAESPVKEDRLVSDKLQGKKPISPYESSNGFTPTFEWVTAI